MKWLATLLILFCGCSHNYKIESFKQNDFYQVLSQNEKELVDEILEKVIDTKHEDYYLKMLTVALTTPVYSFDKIENFNKKRIADAVLEYGRHLSALQELNVNVIKYLTREELNEYFYIDYMIACQEDIFSNLYYVYNADPNDIVVRIQVRLHGDPEIVSKIIYFEDAIEKHLSVPGFSVNLVFIKDSAPASDDIFEVNVDPTKWTTSFNWVGGPNVLAHELMHLMGLPDEYNRILSHVGNKYMPIESRLRLFLMQLNDVELVDSKYGIMCDHNRKPLPRHICSVAHLDESCVISRQRILEYGE